VCVCVCECESVCHCLGGAAVATGHCVVHTVKCSCPVPSRWAVAGTMVFVGGKLTVTARKLLQNVVHRSPGIIAVNKWAGLVCQGDSGGTQLLRPATLAALGKRKNENPRLVHRLDKPTTGVLVFGRTKEMARVLSDMFAAREVTKEYWAVVVGAPTSVHPPPPPHPPPPRGPFP
jgi:23S rRNA-/tRNA-specific pseudouridylate synthase